MVPLLNYYILGISRIVYRNCLSEPVSTYCMSTPSYLEMSSDSTDEGGVPHYAYLVLTIFPPFPIEIAVLCHHAETNDMCLRCSRVGPSPIARVNMVEICPVETLVLQIILRLPYDLSCTIYLYWEQSVTENCRGIVYSLYVADASFRNFIDIFRNVGGAQALIIRNRNISLTKGCTKDIIPPMGCKSPMRVGVLPVGPSSGANLYHVLSHMMIVRGGLGVRVGRGLGAVCLANGISGAVRFGVVAACSLMNLCL